MHECPKAVKLPVFLLSISCTWQAVLPCNNQRQTTTALGFKEPYHAQRDAIKLFISHSSGMFTCLHVV